MASGNLYLLIKSYCEAAGAKLGEELMPYLSRLEARDVNLNHDMKFRRLLRDAGQDPVMEQVQDRFFDSVYWNAVVSAAEAIGISQALSVGVVYDSRVHGSWQRLRDWTNDRFGRVADIGEEGWIQGYLEMRRNWLAQHPNPLLHRTIYRMDAFRELMGDGRQLGVEAGFYLPGVCGE